MRRGHAPFETHAQPPQFTEAKTPRHVVHHRRAVPSSGRVDSSGIPAAELSDVLERHVEVACLFAGGVGGPMHGERGDPWLVREEDGAAVALMDVAIDDEHAISRV